MKFRKRLSLCWRILRVKPDNLMAHADRELPLVGTDEMGLLMADSLRELALVFCTQGHSGFSAGYLRGALDKLLAFKPLGPITGEPHEWIDHGEMKQNQRYGSVFIQSDRFGGQAYDIDAIVFRDPSGATFTGRGSHQPITFPYSPDRIYLDVDDDGKPLNGWNRDGVYADWLKEENQ